MAMVTLLGTGAMGSRMARKLLEARHTVTVFNRTREKTAPLVDAGARDARTPAEAVRDAEIVIAMLRDDVASREVWLISGALDAMPKSAIAVESSTVTVSWIEELAAAARMRGLAMIDAPVAGSRPQAEAGQLIFLAGGETSVVEKVKPVLMSMASHVYHTGASGSGALTKLVINALLGTQIAALAEALAMAKKNGVDEKQTFEIFSSTSVCSPAVKSYGAAMIARNFTPMFPIELVEKDLAYVVRTANESNADVPVTAAAHDVFADALAGGLGAENINAVAKLYD